MFFTTISLALRSIARHKLRSFLTTLGIIIGVAAVVTMVTLGKATTAAVQASISSLGTNILQVRPGAGFGRGGGGPRPSDFKIEDVDAVRKQIAGINAVAEEAQTTVTVIYEGANWSTTVNGTTNDFFRVNPWPLTAGREFSPQELSAGKSVCILGNTVKTNLYREADPIGTQMRISGISCEVIGVLKGKGQAGFGADQDDLVVMPIKAVQRRITGNRDIRVMLVGVNADYSTAQVQASITELMRERRNITKGKDDDFFIFDTKQFTDTLTQTTSLLTGIVSAVAAISLIVGGIGIMNIMLVSVTERTREIGIRLAIGAVAREVLMQFLIEAIALSCIGGVIGIVVAQLVILGLVPLLKVTWLFDLQINIVAFAISAIIGVVFGFFPARRAASLNPIDALRHE